ncbi:hypothetical protein ACOMHN_047279 [Nucella lapillus]
MPTVTTVLVAVVNLIFVADLLRTKLALTHTTTTTTSAFPSSSSSSDGGLMDGGSRVQGHGLRDVLRPLTAVTGAAMVSADVSDDEELTLGSGSGLYLPDVETAAPPHSPLIHTLKDDRRSRRHSTCCFVGKLAASRHLHCLAQYHVDKLNMPEAGQTSKSDVRYDEEDSVTLETLAHCWVSRICTQMRT